MQEPAQNVPNYLVQAILVTLCCCLPFGVVSIIYAAQVNGKVSSGDMAGAVEASNNAKKWAWIGFWCGLAANVIVIGLQVLMGLGAAAAGSGGY